MQKLVALAPLFLLAVYLPGQVMVRCRMDGLLRAACCCSESDEAPAPETALKAQDCCAREITRAERQPVEAVRAADPELGSAAVVAVAVPVAVVDPPVARAVRTLTRHGPAREGPPLRLAKCSFLI